MSDAFEFTASVGESISSAKVTQHTFTAADFLDKPRIIEGNRAARDGRYFTPALYSGDRRQKADIVHAEVLAVDIDRMDKTPLRDALEQIRRSGVEFLFHSTYSHHPDAPRLRLLFRLGRRVSGHEYESLIRCVTQAYCLKADPASQNPAQPMFLPMVSAANAHVAKAQLVNEGGRRIDPDAFLLDIPVEPPRHVDEDLTLPIATPSGLTEASWIACILDAYPAEDLDEDYPEWIRVGMALYAQTSGRGVEQWIAWSRLSPRYRDASDEEVAEWRTKWKTFAPQSGVAPITLRSILSQTSKGSNRRVVTLAYQRAFELCEDIDSLTRVTEYMRQEGRVNPQEMRQMPRHYRAAHRRITKREITLEEAQEIVLQKRIDETLTTYFYDRIVYDVIFQTFVEIETKQPLSRELLQLRHSGKMPLNYRGRPESVHEALLNGLFDIKRPRLIYRHVYRPDDARAVVETDEGHALNLFQPHTWPVVNRPFNAADPIDREIVERIDRHVTLLASGDDMVKRLLLQHLAHLRQRPTERIHWGYALVSAEQGVGKSVWSQLYRAVLGREQIQTVGTQAITDNFNAWLANPVLMTFIEELEFTSGRERDNSIRKMKDWMTSNDVSIRRMRTDTYMAEITTAFAINSNAHNVLGIEADKRRWLPITVTASDAKEIASYLGEPRETFYHRYTELLEEHGHRFAAYFETIPLVDFDRHRFPFTAEKQAIVGRAPAPICQRVLTRMIADEVSGDITNDYFYLPEVVRMIRNEGEHAGDQDVATLANLSSSALSHWINVGAKRLGFRCLEDVSEPYERVRVRLDSVTRASASTIFYRNAPATSARLIVRWLNTELDRRRADNVVHIHRNRDADEFDDIDAL